MKKINKFKIRNLGFLAFTTPLFLVISCSEEKQYLKNQKAYDNLNKHKFAHYKDTFDLTERKKEYPNFFQEVEIVKWIDGDTPKIKYINGKKTNIRITTIDTPEYHLYPSGKETTGVELKYAKKATEFGQKVMPSGSKVLLYSDGSKSYNRVVGSLFYKKTSETKYHSYSVEIMRRGLALPFIELTAVINKIKNIHFIARAFADAYNYAVKNKLNLFSDGIIDHLTVHGTTDVSNVAWREGARDKWDRKNIYDVLKVNQGEV